ncbi:amino acid/amide ABC transporter membrane protein 2, HAAT family [Desulfomicrobium apsheronum]|uniref:Amino acid/amide ABC transporter membrane protein 2, HAAT family n=1 Tax=Desulfomicrobium apsheronum TaxID=52560 RepID=A0A1I3WQZ3_9BACT|nr:branched-chain amino acid ABC transporter permease [Desulfomicrobium apsheronum]SFK09945.1 amino acid/amide ABC transporter membrane protein 2, HAAT family [Desulfomicrobium apsheronum]
MFLDNYGFLMVAIIQQALLGMSLWYPLMAGQLSLASIGFYSLGGYIAAIMGTSPLFAAWRETLGAALYPVEWLIAMLASCLLGLLVGIPALRLRGIYLALATIAFVQVLNVVVLVLDVTGGAVGLFGIPQPFEKRIGYLWFFGPLLIVMLLFSWRLTRTVAGRSFMAIREDELAAQAMGISTTFEKVRAFVIGCGLAGVVGAMSAPFLNTWNARQSSFDASVACLAYVLIGGARSIWGPLLGAILLVALPEVLRPLKDARLIMNGIVLVVACIYLPQGIAGLLASLRRKASGVA